MITKNQSLSSRTEQLVEKTVKTKTQHRVLSVKGTRKRVLNLALVPEKASYTER